MIAPLRTDTKGIIEGWNESPRLVARRFGDQRAAIDWTRRLAVSGYPAKRNGRSVWLETEGLQDSAVEMIMKFGFKSIDEAA